MWQPNKRKYRPRRSRIRRLDPRRYKRMIYAMRCRIRVRCFFAGCYANY